MINDNNRVILVTGGAGHIGEAISRGYLAAGAKVVICGRNAPEQDIVEKDNSAVFIAANLRNNDQCKTLVDQVIERYGRIDVLVNNAGGSPPLDSATAEAWVNEKIVHLNLLAPLLLSQLVFATMRRQYDSEGVMGNIINIAQCQWCSTFTGDCRLWCSQSGSAECYQITGSRMGAGYSRQCYYCWSGSSSSWGRALWR